MSPTGLSSNVRAAAQPDIHPGSRPGSHPGSRPGTRPHPDQRETQGDMSSVEAQLRVSQPPAPLGGFVEIDGVSIVYGGRRGAKSTALQPTSIDLPPSSFTALIGPSGCGKSTLMNAVAGFVAPATGGITIDNAEVTRAKPRRRRHLPAIRVVSLVQRHRQRQVSRSSASASAGRNSKRRAIQALGRSRARKAGATNFPASFPAA